MANGSNPHTATGEVTWMLAGIRDEKAALQKRLDYLSAEEKRLIGQPAAKTAPASKPAAKAAAAPKVLKRKRRISPETREKMRQGAKDRWNRIKGIQSATPQQPTTEQPTAFAPPVETAAPATT